MAEIKAANLAGYINPKAPARDIEGSAIRQKQLAMQEQLHRYKMKAMQESMNQNDIKKKSDDWIARNSNLLYQAKANALDVDSQYFNDPNKMSELMADYKENVGGNYAAFSEFRKMGTANEARSNRRSLEVLREDYTSDKDYKRALNNKLKDMPEEMRNKLFSNLDDDSYMAVSNIYDVDKSYTWRDSLPDIIDENPLTTVGIGSSALAVMALYKRGKIKEGNELLKKSAGKVPTTMGSKKWMTKDADEYKRYQDYIRDTKKKFYDLNGDSPEAKKVADKIFNDKSKKGFNDWQAGQKGGRTSTGDNTTKSAGKGGSGKGRQFNSETGKWEKVSKKGTSNTAMTFTGTGFSRTGGSSSRASDIKYEWMKKQGRILGKNDSLGPVMPGNTGGPGFKKQQTGSYEPPTSNIKQADGSTLTVQNNKKSKVLSKSQIEDAEFSASKKIPKSKMKLYEQNIRNLNRGGQMSDQEAKIIRDAMKKLSKGGATFSQGDVVEEIMKGPAGKDILEKVSSGAISSKLGIIGAGVAGAYLGGFLGGGVGSVFGKKGEAVGDIIGTTAGAVGIVPAVNLIVDKVKQQGVKNVMAKVTTRLGAKTAMKLMASGIFSGITSGPTFGLSNLITAGFIASDVFAIYDILNEEE